MDSKLIGQETTYGNEKFIIKQIEEIRPGLFLGYLENESIHTTLNLGILRIGNDFVDELLKKELNKVDN